MERTIRTGIERLRSVPMFAKLRDKDLATIDRLVDEVEIPAGEVLIRQGSAGARESFVIVSGEAAVEIDGRIVATVGPGELVGEMAMIDGRPRSATVVALTPMTLLVIGPGQFQTFIARPGIALAVLKAVVERLRHLESDPRLPTSEGAGAA